MGTGLPADSSQTRCCVTRGQVEEPVNRAEAALHLRTLLPRGLITPAAKIARRLTQLPGQAYFNKFLEQSSTHLKPGRQLTKLT
jgi:hypothetical protein